MTDIHGDWNFQGAYIEKLNSKTGQLLWYNRYVKEDTGAEEKNLDAYVNDDGNLELINFRNINLEGPYFASYGDSRFAIRVYDGASGSLISHKYQVQVDTSQIVSNDISLRSSHGKVDGYNVVIDRNKTKGKFGLVAKYIDENAKIVKKDSFYIDKKYKYFSIGSWQRLKDNPTNNHRYDKDLWIVKTNNTGCLVEVCGLEQWIQEDEVKIYTCKFLQANPEWYYSPYSTDCIEELHEVNIIGDTILGNRLCSILGVYEEGAFQDGSYLIVFYELDHVFFYEDEKFKTLYDFSRDIVPGDTVSYYLPQNIGYYDNSSSSNSYVPSKDPYRYFCMGY